MFCEDTDAYRKRLDVHYTPDFGNNRYFDAVESNQVTK